MKIKEPKCSLYSIYIQCVHFVNFFNQLIERAIFGEEHAKNPTKNFYQLFIGNEKLEDNLIILIEEKTMI